MNSNDVIQILNTMNRKAKHNLGQNFLVSELYADLIAALLEINDGDCVLEIGSGLGALTKFLTQYEAPLTLVEYDYDYVDYLTRLYLNSPNVHVIHQDILKTNLSSYTKIIGNLPYYITTPIIKKVLLEGTNLKKFVFMIQKEVALKLLNTFNTKDYGPLHVVINYLGILKHEKDLKPSNFYPRPFVDSSVLSLTIKENVSHDFASFLYKEVAKLFRFNRKTLRNNLKGNRFEKELQNLFVDAGIILEQRPQEIRPEIYIKVFTKLFQK